MTATQKKAGFRGINAAASLKHDLRAGREPLADAVSAALMPRPH